MENIDKVLENNKSEAAMKIEELEKNINITLENIKKNGVNTGTGFGRQTSHETENERNWDKYGKYGFNKDYKIYETDRWTDNNPTKFRSFKLMAERYLLSAKPAYAEGIGKMLEYTKNKDNVIDLKEKNEKG